MSRAGIEFVCNNKTKCLYVYIYNEKLLYMRLKNKNMGMKKL